MEVEYINKMQTQPRKLEWPSDVVLELIDLWIVHKCLYDNSHRYYTNKNARFNALRNIAESLHYRMPDLGPNDVKTKIHYLRGQYARELARLQQNNSKNGTDSDGCGGDDDPFSYVPTTYWFNKISFLKEFIKTKERKHNDASKTISPSIDESDTDPLELLREPSKLRAKRSKICDYSESASNSRIKDESSKVSNDIEKEMKPLMAATTVVATAPLPVITAVSTVPSSTHLTATLQSPLVCSRQNIIQNVQSDIDAFGNHIKLEMHKITDGELQDEIQHKIQNLLYEYKSKQRALNKQS